VLNALIPATYIFILERGAQLAFFLFADGTSSIRDQPKQKTLHSKPKILNKDITPEIISDEQLQEVAAVWQMSKTTAVLPSTRRRLRSTCKFLNQ
jgi:hypothetical protein